jgi:hypothetical protein
VRFSEKKKKEYVAYAHKFMVNNTCSIRNRARDIIQSMTFPKYIGLSYIIYNIWSGIHEDGEVYEAVLFTWDKNGAL